MSEEKPLTPISERAPAINFSCRDGKKLTSLLWNQDDLLNKKRRWLVELPTIYIPDGSKKKSKMPKFLTDVSLTESCLRSDEVSYENVRSSVEQSFGAFSGSQRKHHVVQDYLQFFETLNIESYSVDPSHLLGKFYSMMNVLSNNALYLVANLVTSNKIRFKKTRPSMKKIIKDHLPRFLEQLSDKSCPTPMEQLSEIFKDPGNFRKKQLTLLTTVSPPLLSSIHKALQELDELPFQDIVAMNRKLRDITVVPQFPPTRFSGKRDLLLERVNKRCQKVLSTLKEGADLPKPFAKALSIIQLSLKQKTRRVEIMASEFYPFSLETVGLQNELLGALWSLPKVRINELKALQLLVDPEARFPRKTFRIALRKYLMDYLFGCDVVDIPDEVLRIIASLNRRSRRRLQLFSVGMMNEDVEATLNISSQLKQAVSNFLPDDTLDENSDALGSDDDTKNNDFDLAQNSYCSSPTGLGQGFILNDQVEGTGDSGVATKNQGHSLHRTDSCVIGSFSKQQAILEEEDSDHIIDDLRYHLHRREGDMVDGFIKKQPKLEQTDYTNPSKHYLEKVSTVGNLVERSSLEGDDTNPSQHLENASMTSDSIRKSNFDPGDDNCPEGTLGTAGMRETLIQEICDETSLVAYRLIGHMLDKFLLVEGRDTNEMTRYYLRGGSSLESTGTEDTINGSNEDTGTKILVQSVQELLPTLPKSRVERVEELMG